jgi:hypothetical protein
MNRACFLLVLFSAPQIFAACMRGDEPVALKELQRVRSGSVDVVLLSPNEALRQGRDAIFVEFRSAADGHLIDVGEVQATATMPMAGMAPMSGAIDVTPTDSAGRYAVATNLSMAGDWRIGVEWNGPAGRGSVLLSASAQ